MYEPTALLSEAEIRCHLRASEAEIRCHYRASESLLDFTAKFHCWNQGLWRESIGKGSTWFGAFGNSNQTIPLIQFLPQKLRKQHIFKISKIRHSNVISSQIEFPADLLQLFFTFDRSTCNFSSPSTVITAFISPSINFQADLHVYSSHNLWTSDLFNNCCKSIYCKIPKQ